MKRESIVILLLVIAAVISAVSFVVNLSILNDIGIQDKIFFGGSGGGEKGGNVQIFVGGAENEG